MYTNFPITVNECVYVCICARAQLVVCNNTQAKKYKHMMIRPNFYTLHQHINKCVRYVHLYARVNANVKPTFVCRCEGMYMCVYEYLYV